MWEMGKQIIGNSEKFNQNVFTSKSWTSFSLTATQVQVALIDVTVVILLSNFICSKITQLN